MTELRRIRRVCGLSVKELAGMVGVSPMSIYRYETGFRVPDLDIAARIADSLGCHIEELLNRKKVG